MNIPQHALKARCSSGRAPHRAGPPLVAAEVVRGAVQQALAKVDRLLEKCDGGFLDATCVRGSYGVHTLDGIVDANAWTTGFWPGMLWLAHELSGEARYAAAARAYVPLMRERLDRGVWVDHHDLGFLYTLTCVASFKLTGDPLARETALLAARRLHGRYRPKGGFIQAWGDLGDAANYRLIVDGLMNLPLLYWAARETGQGELATAANRHVDRTLTTIIRSDGSTYHTYFFDPNTGAPSHGVTRQGVADASCWARGQAWGMYGIPLVRRYGDDEGVMNAHDRVSDYFLGHLPVDSVCYWDLLFTSGGEERDSSAAAIAVCGLLEALAWTDDAGRRQRYEAAVQSILLRLIRDYAAGDEEDGLLSHAVYSKPHQAGVDECCLWGDYFYLEALRRLTGSWSPYW